MSNNQSQSQPQTQTLYTKVQTGLNFAQREQAVLELWSKHNIFHKSMAMREGSPMFVFYDGPPTANGRPHMGHIIARAIKDLFPRYKTMKGCHVLRKAGWDTHGLPVELEVEKALGISGKPDIEKYGVEPFIQKCKESVWTYETMWKEMSERVGFWADMEKPYVTYHNSYIESVWWALSKIWEKGLIYKSYRVVPYCPRCGTPLSSHEVAQGYKEVTEPSAYVRFNVAGKKDEYLLAWTTTPWTLPSNVGLCVNAKEEYVRAAKDGHVYILAKALVEKVLEDSYEILETFTGAKLEGLKYEPLFDFERPEDANDANSKYCTVVCDGYVTLKDGTGIVHIAPAFGDDDARISKAYGLPLLQLVDAQGCFVDSVNLWAGKFVKDADPLIIKELATRGLLHKKEAYTHNYPYCWRCDTPLLYYARDAWFIQVSKLKDELLASNSNVNWLPEHMKEGRFGDFLKNIHDWSISRERYWGTPLPIWECTAGKHSEDPNDACGYLHCVSGIAELKNMGATSHSSKDNTAASMADDIELHKPYIDDIRLNCPQCGGEMVRTPEVIDCWFDSGSMPFAQWHYPYENQDIFAKQFPADIISEGLDQTRGWFYSLMSISTMLFGKSPYKNVIVTGLVQNKDGQKMSKSKGDVVDPMHALDKHGADAVRWLFYAGAAPWQNTRYHDDAVAEGSRRFMGTLWNTYAFYVLYAGIDGFDPNVHQSKDLSVLDSWLLSRLNTLVKKVDTALDRFEVTEPARALDAFVDELSNWYLRRSRERFWADGMGQDKINAYRVLHHALVTVAKLAAPFVPFITEQIYQNLVRGLDAAAPESVHLCDYPVADERFIDPALEADMSAIMDITAIGRAARNAAAIKNRQPLPEMLVSLKAGSAKPDASLLDVVREELNVKAISFIENTEEYVEYRFKPQLRTLGPRYGKLVPKITEALNAEPAAVMAALNSGGWRTTIDDVDIELSLEDVLPESIQKEGFAVSTDRGVTVVLDTRLTPELIEEGNVRELISKLQNMRKDAGYEVVDRIHAGYNNNTPGLGDVISNNYETIAGEILADSLKHSAPPTGAYAKQWDINGENIGLWVMKV
ncbi:MAG: isoleucine--tRNA ligase [Defluviitaleaceae bacterium]|nr:isoleucine--tRNA ligase [Defluviitaleaceae bacterium]